MDKTLPKAITQVMLQEDYNSCDTFEHEGETYYSLGNVSSDGTPFEDGLPVIYFVQRGTAIQLPFNMALELLSQLPDNE